MHRRAVGRRRLAFGGSGCARSRIHIRIHSDQSGFELSFAYPALDAWPAKFDLVEAM
jgi:hypothetical protein